MSLITDLDGFRCVNFKASRRTLASGRFDLDNPCSWCGNRRQHGAAGPAFFYVEYGRWEFPFIAEAQCDNFSLIHKPSLPPIGEPTLRAAQQIHTQRNRIAEVGRKYARQWVAFDPSEVKTFMSSTLRPGEIHYPHERGPGDFFRSVNDLRSDLFSMHLELRECTKQFREAWGITDSRLDSWFKTTTDQMRFLSVQIDELEAARHGSPLSIVSRWAFNTAIGGASWDGLKLATSALRAVVRGLT